MMMLLVLVPLGALLLLLAAAGFVWAVRHDQFDDLEAEGMRILFDDLPDPARPVEPVARAESTDAGEPAGHPKPGPEPAAQGREWTGSR